MILLVQAVVSLGMLIVVPLGLTLHPTRTTSTRWWFAFAVPGAVSLWLPRGVVSIVLASIVAVDGCHTWRGECGWLCVVWRTGDATGGA
ncbi:hypothetical protein JOF29_006189 [Kribbella aluminosa]|uniref:Uncharacterized protein n=1 Tax=Kribbella aluminosa TaxID=416017 RepID=A0ABS4UTV7_9ACTN|nr:YndJ family transporter [Kribbella aluminosa]MBP2355079.1 hypothetical protein [Kribbella aluminosa]